MKNFKKVLALVLAIATVFTFAAMATAAEVKYDDLTDTASINHVEAVQVLTGVGVINGFEDKTFKPAESVTRVQMAKMVGFIMNDGDDINDLYKAACPFADSKSNWGAGYIAYCATQGIVNGRDANTFDPNATVTGVEAAKMLLCALGYDATIEGFTGADWSVNVLNVAKKAGLFEDLSQGKMGAALNREDAAQMIFNALKAEEVEYDNKGTTVTINGATIATGASKATTVETVHLQFDGTKGVKAPLLWGEDHFIDSADSAKQLKLVKDNSDPFGIATNKWYYGKDVDNKDIELSKDLKLAKTFVGSMTAEELYALTGKYDAKKDATDTDYDEIVIKVDGANATDSAVSSKVYDKIADWTNGNILNETTSTQRGNSKFLADEIEVYVNDHPDHDGRLIQIIGKSYFLGTITAWNEAKKTTDKENIKVGTVGTFNTTEFSKDDVDNETKVVYTLAKGAIQSVKKAEIVKSGAVTKISTDKDGNTVITADGKTYTFKGDHKAEVKLDGEYDLYFAPTGKVLGVEETKSGSDNYYMVMKTGEIAGSGLDKADTVYQVRLLGTDGKTVDLNVAKVDGTKVGALADLPAAATAADEDLEIKDAKVGAIVTYTLNSKGEAELTTASADFATDTQELKKTDGTIAAVNYENMTEVAKFLTSKKATSDTTFVLISLDKNGNYVYTPVSGIAAMKAALGNYNYYQNITVEVKSSGSKNIDVAGAAFIFVDARNVTSTKTVFSTIDISTEKEESISGKTNRTVKYFEVTAIEGNEIKTLKVENTADAYDKIKDAKFTLASSYDVDDDGFVTKITKADNAFVGTVLAKDMALGYKSGTLTLGELELTQDNVNVFLYDADKEEFTSQKVAKDMKEDIKADTTLFFYYNTTSNTTKTVVAIFGEAK